MKWLNEAEQFHAMTPLGRALCVGIEPDLPDPEWLTFVLATGEPWWWQNRYFRRAPNVTNGLKGMSPFVPVNLETQRQIERYKAAGWLPKIFDPGIVLTWP